MRRCVIFVVAPIYVEGCGSRRPLRRDMKFRLPMPCSAALLSAEGEKSSKVTYFEVIEGGMIECALNSARIERGVYVKTYDRGSDI